MLHLILNIEENKVVGFYNRNNFIYKVNEIAINENNNLLISDNSTAIGYLLLNNKYSFRLIDIDETDIKQIVNDLNQTITDDMLYHIAKNYDNNSIEEWYVQVESLMYDYLFSFESA